MQDRGELEAFVEAMAQALRLDLSSASGPAVQAHLAVAFGMATLLTDFPLDDHAEPAPVFSA